jgi:hypothetical protein
LGDLDGVLRAIQLGISFEGTSSNRQRGWVAQPGKRVALMIVLGAILLLIGLIASIPVLWTIGIVLVAAGAVLALVGRAGHSIGGRPHWY